MAPLNPKDWAESLEKLDTISGRLLVGLLVPAIVLAIWPPFAQFRTDNAHWFAPTFAVLSGIVLVRCIWWLYGRAAIWVGRRHALVKMQREIFKLSPDEFFYVIEALKTDSPAISVPNLDRGITLLLSKRFIVRVGISTDRWEHQFLFNDAVWEYLKMHSDAVEESALRFFSTGTDDG